MSALVFDDYQEGALGPGHLAAGHGLSVLIEIFQKISIYISTVNILADRCGRKLLVSNLLLFSFFLASNEHCHVSCWDYDHNLQTSLT